VYVISDVFSSATVFVYAVMASRVAFVAAYCYDCHYCVILHEL